MNGEVELVPVVKAGAADSGAAHVKPGGFDDVKTGIHAHALAGDIACVGRYLRLVKNNVQHFSVDKGPRVQ